MTYAFFDFDGTLVKKDSLPYFLFSLNPFHISLLRTIQSLPILLKYKMGNISNHEAKESLYQLFIGSMNETAFKTKAQKFSDSWIDKHLHSPALDKFKWHIAQGHKVYIISASIENYILPWANKYGVNVIGTQLSFLKEAHVSFSSMNCYGPEKVNRIHAEIQPKSEDVIYAYGDSNGDREMLEMADFPFLNRFS